MARSEIFYETAMALWPLSRLLYRLGNRPLLRQVSRPFFRALNSEAIIIPVHETISEPESVVLPYPLLTPLIEGVDTRFLMSECMCRRGEGCQAFPHDFGCLFLGDGTAKIRPSMGRWVGADEAMVHVQQAMEIGLIPLVVHTPFDGLMLGIPYREMVGICFCCECCCTVQQGLRLGPPAFWDIVGRLPGLVVEVTDRCVRCGACEEICHVDALLASNGRMRVDTERCKACGRCVGACPVGAIRMEIENTATAVDQFLSRIARRAQIGLRREELARGAR